jgi:hypothetical protein
MLIYDVNTLSLEISLLLCRVSVSRVLYTLNGDLKMRKATELGPLSSMNRITLVKSGTSYQYISRIFSGSDSVFRYSDLYTLDLNGRVDNYTSLEGQLIQAWNSSVNSKLDGVSICFCSLLRGKQY